MKASLLLLCLIVGFLTTTITAVVAQDSALDSHSKASNATKLDKLAQKLDLTETQIATIQEAFEGEVTKEERKKLFTEVLTEEQQATLAESLESKRHSRAHHRAHRGHHRHRAHRGHRQHKDPEVRNKLTEMRTALEAKISEEDRVTLATLRADLRSARKDRKAHRAQRHGCKEKCEEGKTKEEMSPEQKQARQEEGRAKRAELREKREAAYATLRQLRLKYEEDITTLFSENETFFVDKKAEHQQRRQEKFEEKGKEIHSHSEAREARRQAHAGQPRPRRQVAFLLMEADIPTELTEISEPQPNVLTIAPNPAGSQTTLSYELTSGGKIQIELRDIQGNLVEVLKSETLTAGKYEQVLPTSQLASQVYLVTLWDGKQRVTEKLIVQK